MIEKIGKLLTNREVRQNALLMLTPEAAPYLHNFLRKKYGHPVFHPDTPTDIRHPVTLNDKVDWLKYFVYNKSPLVQQCYDKYLVRDYVISRGCESTLNECYGVWDDVDQIPWEELPEEYVLKAANGCGAHTFRRAGEAVDPEEVKKRFRYVETRRKKYRMDGTVYAARGKQRYICEKLMRGADGNVPSDYKFWCFNGEPRYWMYIWDRQGPEGYRITYKTVDLQDCSYLDAHAVNAEAPVPGCYSEMLDVARKLSAPFPFVRVDLYDVDDRPVFGELTFVPAQMPDPEHQTEAGSWLDLGNIETYKKNLCRK